MGLKESWGLWAFYGITKSFLFPKLRDIAFFRQRKKHQKEKEAALFQ